MENRFLSKFDNVLILNVKTKNLDRFLTNLYKLNIDIFKVDVINYKEVNIEIYEKDLKKVKKISILNNINIIDYKGKKKRKNKLLFNKTLIISVVFGILFLIFLSNIIFEIEVNHTSKEVRNFIMDELTENGIKRLQFKKSFDKLEKIKKNIIENNKDKIEWLEIEVVGTKYIVKVEERKFDSNSNNYMYQDIIATHDAVIKKIVAESGVKVKEVNEYVKKGETIISGSIYLNENVKGYVKAIGKIYGEVWYKLSIEYPLVSFKKYKTGNKKSVLSINFFDKNYILFNKNTYNNSEVEKTFLLKNNLLPISFSKDIIYELNDLSGIYVEGEALLNAKNYADLKVKEMLKEDEYIINDKLLKYELNSNTIYIDVFYKIYANITGTKEIVKEEGE